MVQVDVFWSYGLASGLTLAAGDKLKNKSSFWVNSTFVGVLLWISLIFAPSGMYLLWNFPYWETMFVAEDYSSIPAWLVTLFALTNITQGILGFAVTSYYLRKDNWKAARFQTIWSHLAMAFILVFGWDGTGWRRFTYSGTGHDWYSGVVYPFSSFFSSPIFFGLLGLGVFFIPSFIIAYRMIQRSQ